MSFHPARTLERMGFARSAERLRSVRTAVALRPASISELPWLAGSVWWWLREPFGRSAYRVLSEAELRATRHSDVAFVFGSGPTVRDIGDDDWARIAEHDTVAFSHFHLQQKVRIDYHLIAEVIDWEETSTSLRSNPRYARTIYLVMKGWLAHGSNHLVGARLLPQDARIFRYRRVARGRTAAPSSAFAHGLVHGSNTSLDVVNFALLMGWKRVVIAGVDLYNKEYFFLPPGVARDDERPQFSVDSRFHQADHMLEMFGLWRDDAASRGVELLVYDARSLLSQVLPVFSWSGSPAA